MIKTVLQSISGVEVYPIISLLLFVCAFVLVIIRVLGYSKSEVKQYSRMPLENSETSNDHAGRE